MSAPHDLDSERGLLGDLIGIPMRVPEVMAIVTPADFYMPSHATIFAAIVSLHESGHAVSVDALREELLQSGDLKSAGGSQGIASVSMAATGAWKKHAATVARLAALRRVLTLAIQLKDLAMDPSTDPASVVAEAIRDFEAVDLPNVELPSSLISMDVLIDESESSAGGVRLPWVIPGQMRATSRAVIVAPEGRGKSVMTRQVAMCASQGVHPFMFAPIPPIRSLLVDLENPAEAITETAGPIRSKLRTKQQGLYREDECWVWHEPGGIDLRQPRWRAEFDRVLDAVQPDLVCLGPLYKAYRTAAKESDELAAGEIQNVFDDMRVRYGFALILEHHAPKGAAGSSRDLVPFGSSLWLRWPEFGLKLLPGDNDSLIVKRWRGDRVKVSWPDELHRGGINGWPWVGWWKDGMDF